MGNKYPNDGGDQVRADERTAEENSSCRRHSSTIGSVRMEDHMAKDRTLQAELLRIGSAVTWPESVPFPELENKEGYGRNIRGLTDAIDATKIPANAAINIVEIGSELGGSTRTFLKKFSNAHLFSIDPYIGNYPLPDAWKEKLSPLAAQDGGSLIKIFQSLLWEHRQRITTVRDWSLNGLAAVHKAGISADIVFIDGDHRYHGALADLILSRCLFPSAILVGDDMAFAPTAPKYKGYSLPVTKAVEDFCDHFETTYDIFSRNTFLIRPQKYAPRTW